jgi:hypothetical protein
LNTLTWTNPLESRHLTWCEDLAYILFCTSNHESLRHNRDLDSPMQDTHCQAYQKFNNFYVPLP